MAFDLAGLLTNIREHAARVLKVRLDRGPLATVARLTEFVHMRAAYVAQTSLYGYLKTRMGTRYVELFQDPTFSQSLNRAKWPVYASCLADLTIFAVALTRAQGGLTPEEAAALASACFDSAVDQTFEGEFAAAIAAAAKADFARRASLTDWAAAVEGETAFARSPKDLIAHAPVSDEFKALDEEIVTNSMRFRWRDVRDQLRRRLDGAKVAGDWRSRPASPPSAGA
ncbi:MAG: hypothetical protein KDJ41_04350 [Hyphomicrobiaceae bacterium]|nr:hypothetical protein [Hyphomicrobiaceae bacterium]